MHVHYALQLAELENYQDYCNRLKKLTFYDVHAVSLLIVFQEPSKSLEQLSVTTLSKNTMYSTSLACLKSDNSRHECTKEHFVSFNYQADRQLATTDMCNGHQYVSTNTDLVYDYTSNANETYVSA